MTAKLGALLAAVLLVSAPLAAATPARPPENPNIDMAGFLKTANAAAKIRPGRRLSEFDFLQASREKGAIILDARSREKYDELHIRGAASLPFPDITIESIANLIPDKNTKILIYCNNNFRNADVPFPSKLPSASLNLSTWIALTNYGYRNVWELAPLLDIEKTILPFEGKSADSGRAQLPMVQSIRLQKAK